MTFRGCLLMKEDALELLGFGALKEGKVGFEAEQMWKMLRVVPIWC